MVLNLCVIVLSTFAVTPSGTVSGLSYHRTRTGRTTADYLQPRRVGKSEVSAAVADATAIALISPRASMQSPNKRIATAPDKREYQAHSDPDLARSGEIADRRKGLIGDRSEWIQANFATRATP